LTEVTEELLDADHERSQNRRLPVTTSRFRWRSHCPNTVVRMADSEVQITADLVHDLLQ